MYVYKKYTELGCSKPTQKLLPEKREDRKRWQTTKFPGDKSRFNYLTAKLKQHLHIE